MALVADEFLTRLTEKMFAVDHHSMELAVDSSMFCRVTRSVENPELNAEIPVP